MDCLSSEDLKEERTEFALAESICAILALSSPEPGGSPTASMTVIAMFRQSWNGH